MTIAELNRRFCELAGIEPKQTRSGYYKNPDFTVNLKDALEVMWIRSDWPDFCRVVGTFTGHGKLSIEYILAPRLFVEDAVKWMEEKK